MHLEHIYAQQARNKFPADPAVIRAGAGLHMVAAAVVVLGDDGGRRQSGHKCGGPRAGGRWPTVGARTRGVASVADAGSPPLRSAHQAEGTVSCWIYGPCLETTVVSRAVRGDLAGGGAARRRHPDGSGQDPPLLTSAQLPGILTVADRAESPQREPMHETRGGSHDAGAPSRGWRDGAPLPRPRAAHPEDVLAGTAPSDGALSAVGTVPTDPRLDIDTHAWGLRSVALLARPRGLGFSAEVPPP